MFNPARSFVFDERSQSCIKDITVISDSLSELHVTDSQPLKETFECRLRPPRTLPPNFPSHVRFGRYSLSVGLFAHAQVSIYPFVSQCGGVWSEPTALCHQSDV